MVKSVSGPIITQRKMKGSMVQQYPYSIKWVKIVAILHIDGAISIFLIFCDFKTLNLSNYKCKVV